MAHSAALLDVRLAAFPSLECQQWRAGLVGQLSLPCRLGFQLSSQSQCSSSVCCQISKNTAKRHTGFSYGASSSRFSKESAREPRKSFRVCAQGNADGSGDEVEAQRQASAAQSEPRPVQEVESGERVDTELKLKRQSQIAVQFGRHYEIMYLISEKEIENVPRIINFYRGCVEKNGGIVWRLNDWGVRQLAYRIKKQRRANYVLMNFECIPGLMVAIEKVMRQDPRIIRQLIVKQKRAITKPCPPPPEYRRPEIGSLLQKDDDGNIIALQDEDEWEEYDEYEEYEEGFDEFDEGEEGDFLFEEEDEDELDYEEDGEEDRLEGAKPSKEALRQQ
ncbi:putative mitochondrial ribosomal protein S6 precursor [Klebsormidium nitens]|uniref:Putative mitochondrial ribosomal protein S6 n=1 Tax=Klebsormidium nitens TaxID=105231 RepID=A0A1Y1IF48_KLENI|nr:putative mitochondrial ribosomal protein S6 precursor [Klebsormidium nitens]|eukprot:GAQ88632.1 putative mitochondrial ribosomal protein S6 precursor [Klebsormidium nitens]